MDDGAVSGSAGTVSGELRGAVCECARQVAADRLVTGTAGNVSARAGELVVITPSGCRCDRLRPEDLCVVDLDGRPVDVPRQPSSELPMHLAAYRVSGAGAVVHTHSMFATTVASSCEELPAIHYAIGFLGGPVRVVPYATFGTRQLADGLAAALAGRSAALLASHGAVALGRDPGHACEQARLLEWLAELYYRCCELGSPRVLTADELAAFAVQAASLSYGDGRGPRPAGG